MSNIFDEATANTEEMFSSEQMSLADVPPVEQPTEAVETPPAEQVEQPTQEENTLNEAVNKILNDEVEAYDYEPIIECGQEPDFFEIVDEFDNTIYRSNE